MHPGGSDVGICCAVIELRMAAIGLKYKAKGDRSLYILSFALAQVHYSHGTLLTA